MELTQTVHYSIDKVPLIKGRPAVYSKAILQQEYNQTTASNNAYQLSELRSEVCLIKKYCLKKPLRTHKKLPSCKRSQNPPASFHIFSSKIKGEHARHFQCLKKKRLQVHRAASYRHESSTQKFFTPFT